MGMKWRLDYKNKEEGMANSSTVVEKAKVNFY